MRRSSASSVRSTGVTIYRDPFDVPHVYGRTRADTEFGAGWATAEDRGLDLQLLRGPATDRRARRSRLRRVLGRALRTHVRAERGRPRRSSRQQATARSEDRRRAPAAEGRRRVPPRDQRLLQDQAGGFVTPFTRNDITAIGTLIGAVFGAGGGDEAAARSSSRHCSSGSATRRGSTSGTTCARHRTRRRPSASRARSRTRNGTDRSRCRQRRDRRRELRRRRRDATAAPAPRMLMSNALLIGAKRSSSGHPIFVAGPQVGYFSPGDPHGGRPARRRPRRARRRVPGPRLLPPDRPWPGLRVERDLGELRRRSTSSRRRSAATTRRTTSTRASARRLGTFDAGTLQGPERRARHGARRTARRCTGRSSATRRATARRSRSRSQRSTRGRELLGAIPFQTLSTGGVHSPQEFFKTMSRLRADVQLVLRRLEAHRDVLERAAAAAQPERELRVCRRTGTARTSGAAGSRRCRIRTSSIRRAGRSSTGTTSPRAAFAAADDNWSYGSVHRVQLLQNAAAARHEDATAADRRRRDEPRRDAGSSRWTLIPLLADAMLARGRAERARRADCCSCCSEWDGSRLDCEPRREDRRIPAPRSWTRGGRGSRSRCSRPRSARSPTS